MCLISVVSALSAGVGGVWRSETGHCEYVCCLCVGCLCVRVCVCMCLFVCVRVVRVSDINCVCSLCRCGQMWVECGGVRLGPVSVCVVCVLGVCVCVYVCVCVFVCVCTSVTCV